MFFSKKQAEEVFNIMVNVGGANMAAKESFVEAGTIHDYNYIADNGDTVSLDFWNGATPTITATVLGAHCGDKSKTNEMTAALDEAFAAWINKLTR